VKGLIFRELLLTSNEEFDIEDDDGSPEWEDEVEVPAWDLYVIDIDSDDD